MKRRRIEMRCTEGTSNKFYNVEVVYDLAAEMFIMRAEWGPIGKNPKSMEKGRYGGAYGATNAWSKIITKQSRKGYYVVDEETTPMSELRSQALQNASNASWKANFVDPVQAAPVVVVPDDPPPPAVKPLGSTGTVMRLKRSKAK